jgi:hypothetical protein
MCNPSNSWQRKGKKTKFPSNPKGTFPSIQRTIQKKKRGKFLPNAIIGPITQGLHLENIVRALRKNFSAISLRVFTMPLTQVL